MESDHLVGLFSQRLAFDAAERPELVAALAFIEGAERWGERDVVDWFETYLASRRTMPVPHSLRETGGLVVTIGSYVPGPVLADILSKARARVVRMLSGMLAQPVVDAFLSAAIFAGRVQRTSEGGKARWRASPRTTDPLSDIVLSLFTTDILEHRDFYDQHLSVCVTCGRVSFESGRSGRTGCRAHPLGSQSNEREHVSSAPPPAGAAVLGGTDQLEADLDALRSAWADELSQALRERSGWAHLGAVEVAPPNGLDAIGGYVDRSTLEIPFSRSAADTLMEWRRTRGIRLVERALVYANNALLLRAPPPKQLEPLHGSWASSLDADAPGVVLGNPVDIARVLRAARSGAATTLRGSIADVRPGLAVVLSGHGVACWIVAGLTLYLARNEATVTTLVDVRSRPVASLRRVDVALG